MLMKKFLIVAASIFGVAGAAVAADLPVRQPPPPVPVVGKAPIGKMPIIGKLPLGKAPPPPPPAQGAVITRG
jgi:opacity protein-like surface antigen